MNGSISSGNPGFSGLLRSKPVLLCLLLAGVTLAVYWPVVHGDFLYLDDPDYFMANPHVQGGLTPDNVAWAFTTGHASNWHPLTWLSLMLDAEVFGAGPMGPHLTNLLFHAANTVMLFLLLRCLTAATWRSALVAALFALHPLHVESVAWVAERKDVLSTFFGLLALWAYARYAQKRSRVESRESRVRTVQQAFDPSTLRSRATAEDGRRWILDYGLALAFFALGLLSKPMLVTLPFVMLLLDWWPLGRISECGMRIAESNKPSQLSTLILEKLPFFILSAISCVVTLVMQKKGGTVSTLMMISLSERIANAFISYIRYLGKAFWPVALANPYPHPMHWRLEPVVFAAGWFIALSIAAVWWGRKFPFALVGWLWFVGMLVPVIGLVQVGDQAMADRYTYMPLIGVFIILVWGVGEVCARRRAAGPVAVFFAAIVLIACAWRTRGQLGYWQNTGTLFRHTMAVTDNNYEACNNLGIWLSRHKQIPEAMDCFRESLRIKPDNPDALYNLGNICVKLGRWDEAVDHYRRALQIAPAQVDALNNLGLALTFREQFAEAITNFEAALKLDPDSGSVHNNLGTVLLIEHRFDEAARQYREAVRLAPDDPQFCANLGDALVRLGQVSEAAKYYQEALRLKPGDAKIEAKLQALGRPGSN